MKRTSFSLRFLREEPGKFEGGGQGACSKKLGIRNTKEEKGESQTGRKGNATSLGISGRGGQHTKVYEGESGAALDPCGGFTSRKQPLLV